MAYGDRRKELEAQDTAEIAAVLDVIVPDAARFLARLKAQGLTVAKIRDVSAWERHSRIEEDERKAAEAAARVAAKAAALPYSGAIKQCQVGVTSNDRASTYYRCSKKGTAVIAHQERGDGGDGRMVVCGTHVRDRLPSRYSGNSGGGRKQPGA